MRYIFRGSGEVFVPLLHKMVKPGDIVETDEPINNADFQPAPLKSERTAKED